MAAFKVGFCKFLLVLEAVFMVSLLSAAVEATLAVGTALLYAALSVAAADFLCRVLLPRRTPHGGSGKTGGAADAPVIRVVPGGRAA